MVIQNIYVQLALLSQTIYHRSLHIGPIMWIKLIFLTASQHRHHNYPHNITTYMYNQSKSKR